MRQRTPARWMIVGWCVTLCWAGALSAGPRAAAAGPGPAGLSAADWAAIQAQLPAAPSAGYPGQQAYLKASNPAAGDNFGSGAVAVSGDTVVVSATREDSAATGVEGNQSDNTAAEAGAVYVFVRTNGVWSQQAYLKASNTQAGDMFGYSLAASGDTIVVGAPFEDSAASGINGDQANNSAPEAGAAYVFARANGVWTQQAYLKASNTAAEDYFGWSVGVSGDTIVVGAYYEDSAATGVNGAQANNSATNAGAAYVFARANGAWTQQAYLKASNTRAGAIFGYRVAVDDATIVVGAPGEGSAATGVNGDQANNSAAGAGAVYVFVRANGAWTQQAYLKASNTDAGDYFGLPVAVDGDTIVVGAGFEDSASSGVSGDQANNSASGAGAAYVFARANGVWTQQAYLKASNTAAEDYFGWSVGVSGDTIVVGAYYEDSAATGIDGNQGDNSANAAGAAYVFVRANGAWIQQAYLKASNANSNDSFGVPAAVDGATIVVGAGFEASAASGVNGNQSDNSAFGAGAAYVFVNLGPTAINWATSRVSVDRTRVPAGQTLTYTLSISDAEGGPYTVSATLPAALTILDAPGMAVDGQTVSASGVAPPGLSQRYPITVRVAPDYAGRLSATALVTDGALSRELIAPAVTVVGGAYLPLVVR